MKHVLILLFLVVCISNPGEASTVEPTLNAGEQAELQLIHFLIKIKDFDRLFNISNYQHRRIFICQIAEKSNDQDLKEKINNFESYFKQLGQPLGVDSSEEARIRLYSAARDGNIDLLTSLLKDHVSPNTTLKNELPPLLIAAMNNHVDCVRELIKAQADITHALDIAKRRNFHGAELLLRKTINKLCPATFPKKTKQTCTLI